MMTIMSRMAMTAAAASMALAPIAAQANTRASDNGAIYSPNSLSQPGLARSMNGSRLANIDDADDLAPIILGLLGGALVIAAIIIIDDDDDQSPGT